MQTRRERVRQFTIDEIKSIAWDIAKQKGISQVTVNGIARRMGMGPPTFYSYFKNREALVQELVIDAYGLYRKALVSACKSVPENDLPGKFYSVLIAYREWAVSNPNIFSLFAGPGVQGVDNQDPAVAAASAKVYDVLINLYRKAWQSGVFKLPEMELAMPDMYAALMVRINEKWDLGLPSEIISLILSCTSQVHGMISLELSGRFADIQDDKAFDFYQFQILSIMKGFGIDYTPES